MVIIGPGASEEGGLAPHRCRRYRFVQLSKVTSAALETKTVADQKPKDPPPPPPPAPQPRPTRFGMDAETKPLKKK